MAVATVITLVIQAPIVSAASTVMVPDSETGVVGWGVGVANDTTCVGGTLCDTVDEGVTDKIADYIKTPTTPIGEESVTFGLADVPNVASATQLTVRIYTKANVVGRSQVDTLSVSLLGVTPTPSAQTCTPGDQSWTACTLTFSGSWSQSAVNNMQVNIVRNVLGSGGSASSKADDTWVANVYGSLTYTLAATTAIEQSAYRWFQNTDAASGQSFIKSYGNTNNQDGIYSIAQLNDGGYAVAGSDGYRSGAMFRYSSSGDIQSTRLWSTTVDSRATSVAKTSDGGYISTGSIYGDVGGLRADNIVLGKYASNGAPEWLRTLSSINGAAMGRSVIQTSSGEYVVVGSDGVGGAFLAYYKTSGALLWKTDWSDAGSDDASSVVQTYDGGLVIAGETNSFGAGGKDAFIAKYNNSGTLLWSKTWGGSGTDIANSLVQTSDGGLVIAGETNSFGAGGKDAFIVKFDASGDFMWNKTVGGAYNETASSVIQAADDGLIFTGSTFNSLGNSDLALIKLTSSGSLVWSKTWGGSVNEIGSSVVQTSDGGLAVAGSSDSFGAGDPDLVLLRYDSQYGITNCNPAECLSTSVSVSTPIVSISSPAVTSAIGAPKVVAVSDTATSNWSSNVIAAVVPTDIAAGSSLAAQNIATSFGAGDIIRLRLNLHVSGLQISAASKNFKLQVAPKSTAPSCSAVASGAFSDVTNSSSGIRWADNLNAGNGLNATSGANDPKHGADTTIAQTYHESGTTNFTNKNAVAVGQDGMWDFALTTSTPAVNGNYCFRIVNSDGTLLNSYSQYPELTIASSLPSLGFVNASGSPIGSPAFAMNSKNMLSTCQTSTATLGSSGGSKLRINQTGAATNWNIAIAATGGASSAWSSGSNYYDFNDSAGSPAGCANGSDGDMYAGQLTIDNTTSGLSPQSGCSSTGMSLASGSTAFTGAVGSISLLSGSTSAQANCYWDLYGTTFSQKIPANQPAGSYSLDLTITITAS